MTLQERKAKLLARLEKVVCKRVCVFRALRVRRILKLLEGVEKCG